MCYIQPDEFGAAHCPGKAEQEQRAIPGTGDAGTARSAQLADLGRGQRRRPPRRGAVLAADAAQRLADRRMFGVERMSGDAASPSDGGDPAAQGRHRVALTSRGEIGADDFGRRRHRREAVLRTPSLEVGDIGRVGPQCRLRVGPVLVGFGFRQRHGFAWHRRLDAVQPCHLPLAGLSDGIDHVGSYSMV